MGQGDGCEAPAALVHTVREEPAVKEAVDLAMMRWARTADAWDAITWVLARDPGEGRPVTESGKTRVLTVQGARSIGLPTVNVLYVVEAGVVAIQEARFEDSALHHAGRA